MMNALLLFAASFTAIHLLVSGTRMRGWLIGRIGAGPYMALFSVASALTLGGMIWSYLAVRVPQASEWYALRHLAAVLMWPAIYLILAGVTTPGPTAAGGESRLGDAEPVTAIHRISRHPFLIGMAIWSGVHLSFNPDWASRVFFGAFFVVSVVGTVSIDHKRARQHGAAWLRYAERSSIVPFVAVLRGRTPMVWSELGWWRPLAASTLWLGLLFGHGALFQMPLF